MFNSDSNNEINNNDINWMPKSTTPNTAWWVEQASKIQQLNYSSGLSNCRKLSNYMFEDHLFDLFGLEIEDWIDKNSIVAEFIHWSEVMILPDNHPEHSETLERNLEESEIAVNFSPLHSGLI